MPSLRCVPWCLPAIFFLATPAAGQELAGKLRELNSAVVTDADQAKKLGDMLYQDARGRLREASQRETRLWREIQTRDQWEKYRDQRYEALRRSLGEYPEPPKTIDVKVARTIEGDGYKLENIVFQSRPGLWVTANLYSPLKPTGKPMPGFIIQSSHHNPKTQAELQDMGMTWARAGCVVLVPDTLGHGERRAHTFKNADSYPDKFLTGRQDYYFRYNTSLQLYAIGDSLAGWMANDLMRCVDVLLARPGIDKDKIVLLGSVAGGGDPAGVAAALDKRITCVVPFNFGGPQPETVFPLPPDAEDSFNYAGGGSWESTRNLAFSARDGFLPWVIVGGVAPRYLIHAHEFAWDSERDPVWKRYQKLYAMYNVADRLGVVHGSGSVRGKPPESTHCNNIGIVHRKPMHPYFEKWFGIKAEEFQDRKTSDQLLCLTPEIEAAIRPKKLYEVASEVGAERAEAARKKLASLSPEARAKQLRDNWARLLGNIEPKAPPKVLDRKTEKVGDAVVEWLLLEVEPNIVVPAVLLLPKSGSAAPVVVGFAQQGKQEFLKQRADSVASLLEGGTAVLLADLRGSGETGLGGRGRTSGATSVSATELMLGQPLVGSRVRDVRSLLGYLRTRPEIDKTRMALWGDSFAAVNPPDRRVDVPLELKLPDQAEPMGGVVALLTGLFEPDVKAIYTQGGLASYQSLLGSHFLYVPHDIVVPGALTTGDLADVAAALAPRPLRLDGLVDGLNRRVDAKKSYAAATLDGADKPAAWLTAQLKK